MKNKRLILILISVAIILLIPLVAMQFTDEVDWTIYDFVIAGALLLGTGLICEYTIRKVSNINYRIAFCIAIFIILILIWIELSVGLFGTVFAGS